jgi:hypothetical protein
MHKSYDTKKKKTQGFRWNYFDRKKR